MDAQMNFIQIREEINQLNIYFVNLVQNKQMNRTAIDFFSRGLNDKKTRLSVNVFGLNARFQQKQSPIKRKTSLSHLNFNKFDRKNKNDQEITDRQISPVKNKNIIATSQSIIPANQTMSLIKSKVFKFEGKSLDDAIFSIAHSNLPEVTHKNIKFEHLDRLKMFKPIKKITQEVEMNEQSVNAESQIEEPLKRIHIIDKIKQISKVQYENSSRRNSDLIEKSKKYFIHNLVLQKLEDHNQNIQRYNSQQKFTIRKLHPNVFLASGGMKLHEFKGKTGFAHHDQMKEILLPSSLITNRIGYNSEFVRPKKKQKSQKTILRYRKQKIKNEQDACIDRWQLPGQENVWQI